MFVLKLILTPLIIGLVSLAGRRWGVAISGWLVGLPLTAGPIALFLALEQGTRFAAHSATSALIGLASLYGFCLAYSWLSRWMRWPGCLLAGMGAFLLSTLLLQHVSLPLFISFPCAILALITALLLLPRDRKQIKAGRLPSWEVGGRMLIATAFVLLITESADFLGPQLSGLLAPFPLFATIIAAFTQQFQGAGAARQALRGIVLGSLAFADFFFILSLLVERWGIAAAFGLALIGALLTQGGTLWILKSFSKRTPSTQFPS